VNGAAIPFDYLAALPLREALFRAHSILW